MTTGMIYFHTQYQMPKHFSNSLQEEECVRTRHLHGLISCMLAGIELVMASMFFFVCFFLFLS